MLVAMLKDERAARDGPHHGPRDLDAKPDRSERRAPVGRRELMVVIAGNDRDAAALREPSESIDGPWIRPCGRADERCHGPPGPRFDFDVQLPEEMVEA